MFQLSINEGTLPSLPNDVRKLLSTVNPPAGAMSPVVFRKEVS